MLENMFQLTLKKPSFKIQNFVRWTPDFKHIL